MTTLARKTFEPAFTYAVRRNKNVIFNEGWAETFATLRREYLNAIQKVARSKRTQIKSSLDERHKKCCNGILGEKTYYVKEVAAIIGQSSERVHTYIREGKLHAQVINEGFIITETSLKDFVRIYFLGRIGGEDRL